MTHYTQGTTDRTDLDDVTHAINHAVPYCVRDAYLQAVLDHDAEGAELAVVEVRNGPEPGDMEPESLTVLYLPDPGRACVVWGGDPSWTDADGVDDAVERYLGLGGKEMCN